MDIPISLQNLLEPCKHGRAINFLAKKVYTFIIYMIKRKLTTKMSQANDVILAGDIKVDRGTLQAERLVATKYGG